MSHLHDPATIEQDKRLREALLSSASSHADSMECLGGWVSAVRLRDSAIDADTGTHELVDDDRRAERLLADLVRKGLLEQRVSREANRQFAQQFAGGLPQLLEDIKADVSSGNIGITASAWNVDALALGDGNYAYNADTTTGLTLGHRGGRISTLLGIVTTAAGTVALTPSSTNYVEVSSAGVVSANTVGFTAGRLPLWTVVTGVSAIATITRSAPVYVVPGLAGINGQLLSAPGKTKELLVPLGTVSATTEFRIIAPGTAATLVKASLCVQTTLASDNTNFWTFDMVNRGAGGVSTTPMLLATDTNTTKTTGGSGISADVARTLSLHGTAGNLDTAADNVLRFTATKAAAAANLVGAMLRLDFSFAG